MYKLLAKNVIKEAKLVLGRLLQKIKSPVLIFLVGFMLNLMHI